MSMHFSGSLFEAMAKGTIADGQQLRCLESDYFVSVLVCDRFESGIGNWRTDMGD